MKRNTAKALTVATSLAVAGAVAGSGALGSDFVATPAVAAAAYTVTPATYNSAEAFAPRTDNRSTFAERASRDATNREARAKKLLAAKVKAEASRKALKAKKAAAARKKQLASGPSVSKGSVRSIGKRMAADHGWTGSQWAALDNLWRHESNWGTTSGNPYGAYGIPQSLPGTKMASHGDDWRTNPETQIEWGLDYIDKRWGSPANAWSHFQSHTWY